MSPLMNKSLKQVSSSVGGKLLIVLLASGAYFGLKAIENSKRVFDKEQTAPFAITQTEQERVDKSLVRLKLTDLTSETQTAIKEDVNNVAGLPFKNEDDLISRLNDSILEKKESQSKAKQDQLNTHVKAYIVNQVKFFGDISVPFNELVAKNEVDGEALNKKISAALNGESMSDEAAGIPVSKKKGPRAGELAKLDKSIKEFVPKVEAYNRAKARIEGELKDIDDTAQKKIRDVYNSKADLSSAVSKEREKTYPRDPFSNAILNERSGNFAIYQVIWYFFMIFLVCGMLYVILALLRPFTPFASGTEILKGQTGDFFKRGGGLSPELAKTALVTVAALGIGTAVAVAGFDGGSRNRQSRSDGGDVDIEDPYGRTNTRVAGIGRQPGASEPPTIQVTAPITYPSPPEPYTIYVPSTDGPRIDTLVDKIQGLSDNARIQGEALDEKADKMDTDATATEFANFRDNTLPGLINAKEQTYTEFETPIGRVSKLEAAKAQLENDFFKKLDAAMSTLNTIRDDNLIPPPTTKQLNLFGRLGQIFTGGGRTYMVTDQSYRALAKLMAAAPCTDPTKCPSPCKDPTRECSSNPDNLLLLAKLQTIMGKPPEDEKVFIKSVGPLLLGKWKSVVLSYTRVSN